MQSMLVHIGKDLGSTTEYSETTVNAFAKTNEPCSRQIPINNYCNKTTCFFL